MESRVKLEEFVTLKYSIDLMGRNIVFALKRFTRLKRTHMYAWFSIKSKFYKSYFVPKSKTALRVWLSIEIGRETRTSKGQFAGHPRFGISKISFMAFSCTSFILDFIEIFTVCTSKVYNIKLVIKVQVHLRYKRGETHWFRFQLKCHKWGCRYFCSVPNEKLRTVNFR